MLLRGSSDSDIAYFIRISLRTMGMQLCGVSCFRTSVRIPVADELSVNLL